jgi:hypothetical protein
MQVMLVQVVAIVEIVAPGINTSDRHSHISGNPSGEVPASTTFNIIETS